MNAKSDSEMEAKAEHEELDAMGHEARRHRAHLTRSVLLKTDTRVLPVLALLFLCSFLDRTNVGNAKIIGLEKDLGITDLQYTQGLAVFYATYIASELPSNLVLKKVSPKIWLPCLTAAWGLVTMCLGFVRGYASFVAVRAVLGVTEGGLLPGMVLYLSGLYTRGELALRIGIFYTAASLSGAFGGLLARGLSAIGPRGGLEGWRWIFIIEGLLTIVAGAIAFLALPNSPATARYLTEEEREWAMKRLAGNGDDRFEYVNPIHVAKNTHADSILCSLAREREERFRWSEVRRGVFNVQVWLSSTAYFAILSGLYSFGLFLPTIVNDMHIASNPNETQLWTVIPYAVATPVTVLVAFLSDRLKRRGTLMLVVLPIAIVGYAVIANIKAASPRFAMTCLMAIGLYAAVPCVLVWNSNNSAGHYKRATTSALQLAVANCGGFVATFVYPAKEGPYYHKGHTIILGLLCYAWVAVALNVLWCVKINRDKRRGKYVAFAGCGDDRDPEFKMVL
ncbi:hypothetical protein PLIIFM63780_005577 [Purpureocillium lilacinum]|nr:hypothetical protein PLIIFM63780_005577 [Purpureocillium lilacinum]